MLKNICVFCSSSNDIAKEYFVEAENLGRLIALQESSLIYGGGNIGLMGVLAESVKEHGGKVYGVIPQKFKEQGLAFEHADEMIVTKDLRERKTIMEERADAFIALPGGFGTLEEMMEVVTLKQLHYHQKPLVFINTSNFYQNLFEFFDQMFEAQFAHSKHRNLYYVARDSETAVTYLKSYTP